MSTTARGARTPLRPAPNRTGDWPRGVLLACGPLSALVYVGWHALAALQWEGYSRVSNAISELHLTGAPSKWMLDPWEGLVYNALLIAFGIGVWRSAQGSRALARSVACRSCRAPSSRCGCSSAKQASPPTSSLLLSAS